MSRGDPKFDLKDVKRLAQDYLDGKMQTINFTAPRRSTESVVAVLFCTPILANQKIATGLLKVKETDFYGRKWQWGDVFDEYGLEDYEGHNWYIKFSIVTNDGEYIEEVSFHPLEKEMTLLDGRTLKVTYMALDAKGEKL